jgi:hypothetical protein
MQGISHQNAVEIGEWPRRIREVADVRCDLHIVVHRRNLAEDGAVTVHRMDSAPWREDRSKRHRKRAITASKVRPRRRSKCREATVGEHVKGIALPHHMILIKRTDDA